MELAQDRQWMTRAVELAKRGLFTTTPNPRVGCVIVSRAGDVVGEGYHVKAGEPHAEVNAITQAGESTRGSIAYVTLEPCNHQGRTGACTEALITAGIERVVFGMEDPNPQVSGSGLQRLRAAGIEVVGPVLEDDCRALNPGFIKRMTCGKPWVRCKVAASLDGRTAMSNGESKWITGSAARDDVQRWRAQSCAVITGVGSVIADDPAMTVRLDGVARQPMRVILDSLLRTPPEAKIFYQHGKVAIATCAFKRQGYPATVDVWGMPSQSGRVDLASLLDKLAEQHCNEVLVEAGATLVGAFLSQGLVDEVVVYLAPTLLGSTARPLADFSLQHLSDAVALDIVSLDQIGGDIRVQALVKNGV